MIFLTAMSWLLYRKDIYRARLKLMMPDYLFMAIIVYAFMYVILPIGPSPFLSKALYFKNVLMLGVMYFFGRVMLLKEYQLINLLKLILTLTVIAFIFNVAEKVSNTHFQSLSGYALWLEEIDKSITSGNYGLTWTFEAESGAKRYAAFFANPLELASAMLLSFSTALILFLNKKGHLSQWIYGSILILSVGCLFFAYSRASIAAFFLLLFFIAIILGYYKFILYGLISVLVFVMFIFLFATDDLRYFVIDSLSLADSSSLGHVVEWIEGLESIAANPLGLGLGTSGNAGGVDAEFKVGGENQFIVFGVQLGVPFLLLYIGLIITSIYYSVKAYRVGLGLAEKAIPFIAATFKFAFLLPLMTANAEVYAYVAYLSWWMVGYSVQLYGDAKERTALGMKINTAVN